MKRDEFVKPKEKVKKVSYITFVIDESGSMAGVRDATITGINEQIQQIKKDFGSKTEDIDTFISLIKFNGGVQTVFSNIGLDKLKEITPEDYIPGGNTAMYDAVGEAIDQLNARKDIGDENTSSLVIVVSDGEENASKKFTSESLAKVIGKMNETKRWTFSYLGANQDLSKVSQRTRMSVGNMATFDSHSNSGVLRAFASNAKGISNYAMNLADAEYSFAATSFYANTETTDKEKDLAK
jgi:uncharacterized protein YegL